MGEAKVVVLGAGIIGLTTAHLLSDDPRYSVTLVAKHMPGDYDIEYASPWAGANYLPTSKPGTPLYHYEKDTWAPFQHLAQNLPEAGIHFQDTMLLNRNKDLQTDVGAWKSHLMGTDPWYKDVVPNFRVLSKEELPSGIDSATSFTSVCINTAIYMPWLASQCLRKGVIIKRGIVQHVAEAADLHHSKTKADVVINCTGIASAKLGGVKDSTVIPARGQIVVVRNDPGIMSYISGTDDDPDEVVYMMNRAAGGGCILGGCYQKNSWESQPDLNLASRIMKRCIDLCPDLTGGKGVEALSIVRHGVGLRPWRADGPRIEIEIIDGVRVVHNYGHGGGGYQSSYGSAKEAVRLVGEALK